jgi:8-oxo-dGTP pyrophosphatase MutT (NUDIX family)
MKTKDYTSYPHHHKDVRWNKGKPVAPLVDNDIWKTYGLEGFNYDNLKRIYPWADVFRGGVILIHEGKIFMIREKDRILTDESSREETKIIAGFIGPIKGGADFTQDKSVIDTAIRECCEEVSITLTIENIVFPVFIYARPQVREVLIYFPVILTEIPQIVLNEEELAGGEWYDLKDLNSLQDHMSSPTKSLVYYLKSFPELNAQMRVSA